MRATRLLALMLAGCTEYTVSKEGGDALEEVGDGAPDIEVTPGSIDFGLLAVGEGATATETVTVTNVGTAALELGEISLEDASAPYEIGLVTSILIPPEGSATFTVTFEPQTAVPAVTNVLIDSNDPDEPQVPVALTGEGEAPVIEVSPEEYDFGNTFIGCDILSPVTITNKGNADLVIDEFNYVTASNDLAFDMDEDINGPLPWTLSPEEYVEVFVNYAPLDDHADEGYLQIHSNDPFRETAQASQTGSAELAGENLDLFEQPLRGATDILIIVDNSCSMAEEQSNLASNFSYFAAELVELELDWQLAVITTDNPSFRGEMMTPETDDLEAEFVAQAVAGINGSGDEKPTEMAYQATQPGADAGPGSEFLRDDAMLSFIFVSDEPDSSPDTWSDYLAYFQSIKPDADNFIAHAISGDYPTGCGTASYTNKVYELTVATSGLYLSVCATDWASHLEALVEGSAIDLSSFELSDWPVPETIVVRVDGVTVTGTWEYNETDNAIDFDETHVPEGGSTIEVEYALYGDCAQ
ncbi:MAG: choice-of-anchor D domain-containing protein [Myxococcota bacterium]